MVKRALQIIFLAAIAGIAPNAMAMNFYIPQHDENDVTEWIIGGLGVTRIYAEGEIERRDTQRLLELLIEADLDDGIVIFNSTGGSLIESMILGKTLRELGISTGIGRFESGRMIEDGVCASACVYAFAGGAHRYFEAGKQHLGIHQFYAGPQSSEFSSSETQEISGLLVAYLQKMGIDPLAFSISTSAGPDGMFWLSTKQAESLGLATNGVGQVKAELKQRGDQTYLSVEQESADVLGRFLFFCQSDQILVVGGYVSEPEDSKNKYDWLTWSALRIGNKVLHRTRKIDDPKGVNQSDSMIAVFRKLTRAEIADLLEKKSLAVEFGGDGLHYYTTGVNLSPVISNVERFVSNCYGL